MVMDELVEYRQSLLGCMQSTLDELKSMVARIPADQIIQPVEAAGWSAHQITAHLRDKQAQAYLPRLRKILLDQSPCLDSFSGEDWMRVKYRADETLTIILVEYEALWKEEMSLFAVLSEADWSRSGRHPVWGMRTLQWWLEQSLVHARAHIRQLQVYVQKLERQGEQATAGQVC